MPSLPHTPIPAKSDKPIAHVNNFRHDEKGQRRFAPTLFTSSEGFIHIIGIRMSWADTDHKRDFQAGRISGPRGSEPAFVRCKPIK
jgi:hypothetical protein